MGVDADERREDAMVGTAWWDGNGVVGWLLGGRMFVSGVASMGGAWQGQCAVGVKGGLSTKRVSSQ